MILPIILSYNYLENTKKIDGLWIFYKFLEFCKKNNYPIIGREKYFENPKKYEKLWDLNENTRKMYNFEYPDIKYLEKNKKYMIPNRLETLMKDSKITWDYLLTKNFKKLNDKINESIDMIESDYNKKIEVIVTWYPFYGLKKICRERNIKLVSLELSTIRKESYNDTLVSASLNTKYDAFNDYKKYKRFDAKKELLLSREELIILFSYTKDLKDNLTFLKDSPKYDIGYALGLDNDPYEKAYCNLQKEDIISKLLNNYNQEDLLFRLHPQSKTIISDNLNIDTSSSAREFISKCKRMIINVSNIGYEASLFDRSVSYLCGDFLTSFGNTNNIELLNEEVISLDQLNFITFFLYTPYDLVFNSDFLYNIEDNNKISDYYNKNLKYIFKSHGINYKTFHSLPSKERKIYLLKHVHNLNEKEISDLLKIKTESCNDIRKKLANDRNEYNHELDNLSKIVLESDNKIKNLNKELFDCKESIKKLEQIVDDKNIEISRLIDELNKIYNSRSWKITKPIRIINKKIKGE